jgi:hypothetical protein
VTGARGAGGRTALVLAGAAAAAAGSAGPWVTVLGVGVSGLEGDGLITLVLALVAVGSALRRLPARRPGAVRRGHPRRGRARPARHRRPAGRRGGLGLPVTTAGGALLLAAGAASALAGRRGRPVRHAGRA